MNGKKNNNDGYQVFIEDWKPNLTNIKRNPNTPPPSKPQQQSGNSNNNNSSSGNKNN